MYRFGVGGAMELLGIFKEVVMLIFDREIFCNRTVYKTTRIICKSR